MNDIKVEVNRYIRSAGLAGIVSVILILTSATVRLPGTPLNVFTGIAPLAGFELVRSKAEVETILGPVDSEARRIIAGRKPLFGLDFTYSIAIFIYALCELQRRIRPDLHMFTLGGMGMLAIALFLEYFFVHRAADIANAAVITEQAALTLRTIGWVKWSLVLTAVYSCTGFLTTTPPVLRFGTQLMRMSAIAGVIAVAYYERYVGLAVLVMFVGLCGVSALFVFKPELVYEDSSEEEEETGGRAP
jgi:hypothetical protein